MKRWIVALLCLCCFLSPSVAPALEGAYLSTEQLRALEPEYEAFLEALADTLTAQGLLSEAEREAWVLYQLGDYYQNGGYGSILVAYTPGLLLSADETVSMRRFTLETEAGTLWLDTLRRYAEQYSALPGLPLDAELTDAQGEPVPCRFRWTATGGSFLIWDGSLGELVNVGSTYINDGRPLYWMEEPVEGIDEILTLEILYKEEDATMATAQLRVVSGEDFWMPEALQ